MIVRISGEDQYRLADGDGRISELDDAVLKAIQDGDAATFASSFQTLLDHVRSGQRVGEDELTPSDLILPPADLTLAEAGGEFSAEGLIPD